MRQLLCVGPPGCGKTTALSGLAEDAARDYGGESVMLCSLTRAAATQIARAVADVPGENIGTLHSFAYQALDKPEVADSPKGLREWNAWVEAEGARYFQVSGGAVDLDDSATEGGWRGETLGDACYSRYQVIRARMQPLETLTDTEQSFATLWEVFQRETGRVDFTRLLEIALRDVDCAPGNPAVLCMDEAQDTSMLGMRLLRKWGQRAERVAIFGDPLQNLYAWAGTDPEAFTALAAESAQHVLSQSYRVPRGIHARALAWIAPLKARLERQLGQPIAYEPRPAEGEVRRLGGAHFKYPEPALNDAARYLEAGKSVMFLAACSHMLDPLLAVLRHRGIPFHNPWRVKRGDWNPLGGRRGVSPKDRLLSYLRPCPEAWEGAAQEWSAEELWRWVEVLEGKGVLKRGAKTTIEQLAKDVRGLDPLPLETLQGWFEAGALEAALSESRACEFRWLEKHLLATKRRSLTYPMTVARLRGPWALRHTPQVIVGTIHSLKGSEADVVYLFPDLSQAGMIEWSREKDGILRAFYVALTRARESLILCGQAGPAAVTL